MHVTVVLGTYNRLARLKACLDSLREHTLAPMRVVVVDAGSTDGTVAYLQSIATQQLVPVLAGRRSGQARAYNQAFELVDTAFVCWLSDDDVLVWPGIDVAISILEREPRIGMVGLKVRDVLGRQVDAPYLGGVSAIGVLNVNQGVLRTETLRAVGGFSEVFRDYGIDQDLTTKVLLSGQDVVFTRAVAIHHYRADDVEPVRRARHKTHLDLYWLKYGHLARGDVLWAAKYTAWKIFRRVFGMSINSRKYVLGMIARDWHNMLTGRYISIFDPIVCRGKPYHLRQSCPTRLRLARLPPEPAEPEELMYDSSVRPGFLSDPGATDEADGSPARTA